MLPALLLRLRYRMKNTARPMSARPAMKHTTAIPAVAPVLRPEEDCEEASELPVLVVAAAAVALEVVEDVLAEVEEEVLVLDDAAKGNWAGEIALNDLSIRGFSQEAVLFGYEQEDHDSDVVL